MSGSSQVTLSWVKADEEGGTAVIDYELLYHDETTEVFSAIYSNILYES